MRFLLATKTFALPGGKNGIDDGAPPMFAATPLRRFYSLLCSIILTPKTHCAVRSAIASDVKIVLSLNQ